MIRWMFVNKNKNLIHVYVPMWSDTICYLLRSKLILLLKFNMNYYRFFFYSLVLRERICFELGPEAQYPRKPTYSCVEQSPLAEQPKKTNPSQQTQSHADHNIRHRNDEHLRLIIASSGSIGPTYDSYWLRSKFIFLLKFNMNYIIGFFF
jgi:hypothetical protein